MSAAVESVNKARNITFDEALEQTAQNLRDGLESGDLVAVETPRPLGLGSAMNLVNPRRAQALVETQNGVILDDFQLPQL